MSPNEYRMLSCCGLQKVIDSVGNQIPIQDYYRMAVEWCFLHKKEGPVVDALRYAYLNVWVNGTEHRETATFERMIGEYLDEKVTMCACSACGQAEVLKYMQVCNGEVLCEDCKR